jgi:hypothetical protein
VGAWSHIAQLPRDPRACAAASHLSVSRPTQAQGKHWFTGSHLLQAGRYNGDGAWAGQDVTVGIAGAVL